MKSLGNETVSKLLTNQKFDDKDRVIIKGWLN